MRKIKVVVLLVRQLQHGFTKNAKVSPNLTVTRYIATQYAFAALWLLARIPGNVLAHSLSVLAFLVR